MLLLLLYTDQLTLWVCTRCIVALCCMVSRLNVVCGLRVGPYRPGFGFCFVYLTECGKNLSGNVTALVVV
jgi:hypothetical protein